MRPSRQLAFKIRTHGGRRKGAGRHRAGSRVNVSHRPRPVHARHAPAHVTLRATVLPASLRATTVFAAVRSAIAKASRETFRVVAFSVQRDHVHLVVEADGATALARGLQGLAIRVAKAVNATLQRRGAVWADRYHARDLTTPRAVRHPTRCCERDESLGRAVHGSGAAASAGRRRGLNEQPAARHELLGGQNHRPRRRVGRA